MYPKGDESVEGVVDITPRLGRAVLFKSEQMMHMVMPTLGYDNHAMTIYFNQVVEKPQKPHPIPTDWSIFVGIASYRDKELEKTIKLLID